MAAELYMPALFSSFHLAGGERVKVLESKIHVDSGAFNFIYMLFGIAICSRRRCRDLSVDRISLKVEIKRPVQLAAI